MGKMSAEKTKLPNKKHSTGFGLKLNFFKHTAWYQLYSNILKYEFKYYYWIQFSMVKLQGKL